MSRRAAIAAAIAVLAAALGGCGEDGIAEDATVSVYVAAGACAGARQALRSEGPRVGSVRLRIRCLPAVRSGGRFDLARIGANARRASEDSTTIAYVGEIEPRAGRFSAPILEEAGIAQLARTPGIAAMHRIIEAVEEAPRDEGLREALVDRLG